MAVISFSARKDEIWVAARWALRELLADVSAQYPDDRQMAEKFKEAVALDGLHLDLLDPSLAQRITRALGLVVDGVLDGSIKSGISVRYPDAQTLEAYREGLLGLKAVLGAAQVH